MAKKNKEPKFNWHPEIGACTCEIIVDGKKYMGGAICSPEDKDMQNERTGQEIAHQRAIINYYKDVRDNQILPALKALRHLYYTMNQSKYFNPRGYEAKMLYRQIKIKEEEYMALKTIIKDSKDALQDFIDKKEKFYQGVRKIRVAKNKNN